MKHIYDVRYGMLLGGGRDVWRILATNDQGESKWLSVPVEYDQNTDVLKTHSGSIYHIQSFQMDKEEFVKQVTEDIKNKSYKSY